MKKSASIICISIIVLISFFSGCAAIETRTDIEPLLNHLPDLGIESACWYGGVKEDRFSGVGPSTCVVYGIAEIDEEFAQSIKEEYEWEPVEDGDIFEKLRQLKLVEYPYIEDYVYSKDFIEDVANTYKIDIFFDFEYSSIVFYAEYIDF